MSKPTLLDTTELAVPTQACHAAAVTHIKGERLVACFGGTREGMPDVRLYLNWRGLFRRMGGPDTLAMSPRWNPVFATVGGDLLLFYKTGRFCDCWQTWVCQITVEEGLLKIGRSVPLPAGFNGPVKGPPLVDETEGTLYCGSSVETEAGWTAYVEVLERNGQLDFSCSRSAPILPDPETGEAQPIGLIQPALWRDGDGSMHALMRSNTGCAWHAEALNLTRGRWSLAQPTDIRCPNSGLAVVRGGGGQLYVVHNDSPTDRHPLVIRTLSEDGLTVGPATVLAEGVTPKAAWGFTWSPEVSYPYAVAAPDGNIEVAYTYARRAIRVATVQEW